MAEPPIRNEYNNVAEHTWAHEDMLNGASRIAAMGGEVIEGAGEWMKQPENEGVVKWGAFAMAAMAGLSGGNALAGKLGLSKIPVIGGLLSFGFAVAAALAAGTAAGDAAQYAVREARDDGPGRPRQEMPGKMRDDQLALDGKSNQTLLGEFADASIKKQQETDPVTGEPITSEPATSETEIDEPDPIKPTPMTFKT